MDAAERKTVVKREMHNAGARWELRYDVVQVLLGLDEARTPDEQHMYIVEGIYGAIKQNRISLVARLIADTTDLDLETPVQRTMEDPPEICSMLLDQGVDVNRDAHQGATPLHYAASNGNSKTVQLLLDRGAIIEAADDAEYTPLNVAAEENMADTLVVFAGQWG
ncbi:ankyrin repeat-containing domain protein [Aspergillus keveii]|uniref:Ankyrin repeat-containing domain protein n=1 Tax=Aspergillus keveii TaxID=714993 RepID=A0ABR4GIV2_9EURO